MRQQVFLCSPRVADERLATALKSSLERYAGPLLGGPGIRIALPSAEATLADASPESTVEPLAGSQALIVIASPYAAHAAAVSRQCAWWTAHKDPARLFILRADGVIEWNDDAGDFDWNRTTALPTSLRAAIKQKPLVLDAAWARQVGELSDSDPRFLDIVARLAAAIRGIGLDAVASEAARRRRQSRQVALLGGSVLAVVAVGATATAWTAQRQAQMAEQARAAAVERQGQSDAARAAAERQRAELDAQRRLAEDRRSDAERQRAEMERQRSEAEVQSRLADARRVEAEKLRADAEKQAEVSRQSAAMWQTQAEREKQRADTLSRQSEEARIANEGRYSAAEARRAEAERQRSEAERARVEADRQRADSERLRAEADRGRAEAEQRRERAETRLGTAAASAEALAIALARAVTDAAGMPSALSAERRAQIVETAETLYDQLRGASDTPEQRHREAQLRLALADAYVRIGDHRRALDRALAARTALEALQRQTANNGRFDGEILATYIAAGDALRAQGDHARALQSYRDAVPLSEKFAAHDAADGARQHAGAALRLRIAAMLKLMGDTPGAQREAELANDVLRRLVARPDGQRWQPALSEAEATLKSVRGD